MANPHSKGFSPRQRRSLVIPAVPDDTDSCTASALAPPWPLSATDFMDLQRIFQSQNLLILCRSIRYINFWLFKWSLNT